MNKAVILARGLGTRMRKEDAAATLTADQAAVANTGVKALIPTGSGRPFLDYVLTALADAGYSDVCLVIGPEHDAVREYYGRKLKITRLKISFAIQEKPLGTGDAVRAAETFAAGESFLMVNSDNYYPIESLRALRQLTTPGLAGFSQKGLISGNIPAERVMKFAVVQMDERGNLRRILEKPDAATLASLPQPLYVSMNCWRFDAKIFAACKAIKPSPRGELEITDAVQYSLDHLGCAYAVPKFDLPVLDLSSRGDIPQVKEKLAALQVSL